MLYLVIFFIIFIISFALLSLKINFAIEYTRKASDDNAVISVFILGGIIKIKYEIPFMEAEKEGLKLRRIKKKKRIDKDKKKRKGKINITEIKGKIDKTIRLYRNNKHLIKKTICYLKRKLIFKELKLNVQIGVGDAAGTAMIYAFAWTVAGIAFSYIYNNFKVEKHYINIKENFMEKMFNIDLYCIFTVKLVHIIIVALKLFLSIRKNQKKKQACKPMAA